MDNPQSICFKPLVSIIVPVTDDAVDGAKRIANAHAQTWQHCEVVPVYTKRSAESSTAIYSPGNNLVEAINAGILASKGIFISLLLPGTSYLTEKIARQVEFIEKFELQDAIVFCDYTVFDRNNVHGTLITLPSNDPSVMFRNIYSGLPIEFSSLLIPHKVLVEFGPLDEEAGMASLHYFLLNLSKHMPLVGMAEQLLCVSMKNKLTDREKSHLRHIYASFLPEILHLEGSDDYAADIFSMLGEATAARLAQGLPLAAWDTIRTTLRALGDSSYSRRAILSFARPLLRGLFRQLPVSVRRLLHLKMQSQINTNRKRLDFTKIYLDNGFVGTESLSGAGSSLFQTRIIRRELPKLFRQLGVKSILDIPCGDFHWMRDVDLVGIHYTGADVVEEMIEENQRRYAGLSREFKHVDLITGPLPVANLIFCRDCLVHLPYEDALAVLDTIRNSECKWLLTTTFTRTEPNTDLDVIGWRALNLTLPPFNLPQPTMLISEKCTEAGGLAGDKALGLWRIADLKV